MRIHNPQRIRDLTVQDCNMLNSGETGRLLSKKAVDSWDWLYSEKDLVALNHFYEGEFYTMMEKEMTGVQSAITQMECSDIEWSLLTTKEKKYYAFAPFFLRCKAAFLCKWKRKSADLSGDIKLHEKEESPYLQAQESFCDHAIVRCQEIALRLLIEEMRYLDQKGILCGKDPKTRYEDFCERLLSDDKYIAELNQNYPALFTSLDSVMEQETENGLRFAERLQQDWSDLIQWSPELSSAKLSFSVGGSDSHRGGQTVVTVFADQQPVWIYKPHSLYNEVVYQKLSGELLKRCTYTTSIYQIIDRGEYGWCEAVSANGCRSMEGLRNYYRKLGVHLCLCYLFSAADMHRENVIASGEDPILIDMEMILSPSNAVGEETGLLRHTVQATGILPVRIWAESGKGVDLSPIGCEPILETGFHGRMIENPGTTDMRVAYREQVLKGNGHIASCHGIVLSPEEREEYLEEGFQKAYREILNSKEWIAGWLQALSECRSRVLVRHSQQYAMYLRDSFHPQFLLQPYDREIMLADLWLHRSYHGKSEREICRQEIDSLLRLDIPVFMREADSCDLILEDGTRISEYFQESAIDVLRRKLHCWSEEDCRRQISAIRLSFEAVYSVASKGKNSIQFKETEGSIEKWIYHVAEQIKGQYFPRAEGKTGGLLTLLPAGDGSGKYVTAQADPWLYQGEAGVGLFLHAFLRYHQDPELHCIVNEIDGYLQDLDFSKRDWKKERGMFSGMASIPYYYMLVSRITEDHRYLDLARQKAEEWIQIRSVMTTEEDLQEPEDLIGGLSGDMIVLLHLYRETGHSSYLAEAERMGQVLWSRHRRNSHGVYWSSCREGGLAGFSHGNSGMELAFAMLDVYRGKAVKPRISPVRSFENSLLYEKAGNWMDMRGISGDRPESGTDFTAWCHGAAGIGLQRSTLILLGDVSPQTEKDLCLAIHKLENTPRMEKQCLCHGTIGNQMILDELLARAGRAEKPGDKEARWEEIAANLLSGMMSGIEEFNIGFMTGVAGIGYAMIRALHPELPIVLDGIVKSRTDYGQKTTDQAV